MAMTASIGQVLATHLLRSDGQEDICLAMYAPSTGATRDTALIKEVMLPDEGERQVHGNATISGRYVLRVAQRARELKLGVALIHSHPEGRSWQRLSQSDFNAESAYAKLVAMETGLPLVGMTLAADDSWSARRWDSSSAPLEGANVRVLGDRLHVTWNDRLVPPPRETNSQVRTISAWGEQVQADITRLKVLVVGAGSVGSDIAVRLAATGMTQVGAMDFDIVQELNLDRMVFATREDAYAHTPKVEVTGRSCRSAATAEGFDFRAHHMQITSSAGLAEALDYDLIFCCVDRVWPRWVLNQIAYSDLIPVIDGGISISSLPQGGMRGCTRRAHIIRPTAPCMQCNGQVDPSNVRLEQQGLIDDPKYIADSAIEEAGKENVALLAVGVVSMQLDLFVSLAAAPGGQGDPGPVRFRLVDHHLERSRYRAHDGCVFEEATATGDRRADLL